MKRYHLLFLLCTLSVPGVFAAEQGLPADSTDKSGRIPNYPITDSLGPHHKWVETLIEEPNGRGGTNLVPHRYLHLEPGLHYLDGGRWIESHATFENAPNGFEGVQTQHKVFISRDISDPWSVEIETPDGIQLRSRILGLSLYDAESGKSVLLAELVAKEGHIVNRCEVWFLDCFDAIRADVAYVYRNGSFEQNVILRQPLPDPGVSGLNPATTRLEVLTEFDGAAQPTSKHTTVLRSEADPIKRAHMAQPDLEDDELVFGSMRMARGRAFGLSRKSTQGTAPVAKNWSKLDGRQILIEQVELPSMVKALKQAGVEDAPAPVWDAKPQASIKRPLPTRSVAAASPRESRSSLNSGRSGSGIVIDYSLITDISGSVLFGSGTAYVAAPATITGNATFPGGMYIKYAPGASITVIGSVIHYATSGAPILCTAKDDNTVGETITGSTGAPSGYYADYCLWAQANGPYPPDPISYWSFSWARTGLRFSPSAYSRSVQNSSFNECATAICVDGINLPVTSTDFCYVGSRYQLLNGGTVTPSGIIVCGSGGNHPPYFTSFPVTRPDGYNDFVYQDSIASAAVDPDEDSLTFSTISGPAWLSVASNGAISGTPRSNDVGLNSWTIRAQDPSGAFTDTTLTIIVRAVGGAFGSIAEAVDQPSWTFITGGNGKWQYQTGTYYFGGDAAQSGRISDNQTTFTETRVVGPGDLSFYWKVSCEYWCDFLRFCIDGVQQDFISEEVNWTRKSYSLGPGPHTLRWEYKKDGSISAGADAGWVDNIQFTGTRGTWLALGGATDFPVLAWTTGGNGVWVGQTNTWYSGGSAVQNAEVLDSQNAYVQTTIPGPVTLSFYWKLSSEYWCDFLRFYVDNSQVAAISGEVPWNQVTSSIGPGAHTLKWEYSKDNGGSAGADAGWVDGISFLGDVDGDGLPDNWEMQNFGTTAENPNGDYDGDGLSNLQEYQNGTSPVSPALSLRISQPRSGANVP